MLGRSDATLNRHGVRIGTAEIYRTLDTLDEIAGSPVVNLDLPGGGFFMPLFVKLKPGRELDADPGTRLPTRYARAKTPRHVPDRIIEVPEIPLTLTGKKMEVPVRRILMGASPDAFLNRKAMASPHTLDAFVDYAGKQQDYQVG